MKKLDRLILRSFLGPLLLTFSISVFVLLMQFVWKYIDDMVGKGLEFARIAELLLYASATFVPMALPIAILFASIMTMGNFGEKYELVAIKAGGVSLSRVMAPMTIIALLLTAVAFVFSNSIMPKAVLHYRQTLYDITRKKPAINIRPSEFYSDIDGYVIRIDHKDPSDESLHDILVFDHSKGLDESSVVVAKKGFMQVTPDNRYLLFVLENGYSYNELSDEHNRNSRPLTRIKFDRQTITMDISSFAYSQSDEDFFAGNYQMMNVRQLDTTIRSLKSALQQRGCDYANAVSLKMQAFNYYKASATALDRPAPALPPVLHPDALNQARSLAQASLQELDLYHKTIRGEREFINLHYVEWQRKYSLSLACLLLFLIGAPFGSIVRKGGLGLPLVASVLFFVVYYIIGMISEKAVREGAIGPVGMWISTFVFIPIGIFLTYHATTDSALFSAASFRKLLSRPRCLHLWSLHSNHS